jgi:N-acetylneuraminic acid mutarotase
MGRGVLNGKIYISGGINDDWPYDNPAERTLYVYDPATNTWTRRHGMPEGGAWGVTGVINGKLYVVTTCYEPAGPIDYYFVPCENAKFFRYNRVTDQWTILPIPGGTYYLGGVIAGKFYVASSTVPSAGTILKVYDPTSNQWTKKRSLPTPPVYEAAEAAVDGKLYVMGGRGINAAGVWETFRTTRAYNPTTDTWTTKAPLPTARKGSAASRVFLDGRPRIELVGGSRPGNNVAYIP